MYSDVLKQFPPSLSLLRNSLVIFVVYIVCFYHCAPFIVLSYTIFKFDENFLLQIVHKNKTIHAYRFIGGRGGIVKLRTTAPPPYYKRQAYIVDVYIFFLQLSQQQLLYFPMIHVSVINLSTS